MKYLKSMDIFSFKMDFHYKNQNVFHSVFGLILSFLMYSVMIFFFNYFSRDFLNKTNPIVIFRETEFENNFTFPFVDFFKNIQYKFDFNDSSNKLEDTYKNITKISNPIIQMSFVVINYKLLKIQYFVFNEKCDVIFETESNLFNFNCDAELDDEKEILYYEGIYLEREPRNLTEPKNKTLKNINITIDQNCKIILGLDFREKYLEDFSEGSLDITNFNLVYYISDNILNVDKQNFFIPYDIMERIFIPNFKMKKFPQKFFYYNFGIIHLINDDGIIISHKNEEYNLKRNFDSPSMSVSDTDHMKMFEIIINKVMKTYERKYKKLQHVFADIGGIINSLMLFGKIITYELNKKKFYYELINNVFGYETIENKQIPDQINKLKYSVENKTNNHNLFIDINKDISINENINNSSRFIPVSNNTKIRKKSEENKYSKNFKDFIGEGMNYRTPQNKEINLSEFSKMHFNQSKLSPVDSHISFFNNRKLISQHENSNVLLGIIDENLMRTKIEEIIKFKRNKKNLIVNFTFFEFMKLFLCCKNFKNDEFQRKEITFNLFGKKINNCLNIINYCVIFENFEKLKLILLNENQNFSFNYLKNRKFEEISKNNLENNLINVYKYFNGKRGSLNDVDDRLINNFSVDFMDFLNKK